MKMEVFEKCRLEDYEKLRYVNNSWHSVSNDKNVLYNVLWNEYKDDIIINITNRKWLKKIDVNMLIKFFKKTELETYHIHKLFIEAILQKRIDIIRYTLKIMTFSYTTTFFETMIIHLNNMNWDDEFKVLKYLIHLIKKQKISKPNEIKKMIMKRMSRHLDGIEFLVKKYKVINIMEFVLEQDNHEMGLYQLFISYENMRSDNFYTGYKERCYNIAKRKFEIIEYLIDKGGDETEEIRNSIRDFAIKYDNVELIEHLINKRGMNAHEIFRLVIDEGELSLKIIEYLIEEKGVDITMEAIVKSAENDNINLVIYLGRKSIEKSN